MGNLFLFTDSGATSMLCIIGMGWTSKRFCGCGVIIHHFPTIDNAKLLYPPSSHLSIEIICSEINVHPDSSSINPMNTKRNFSKVENPKNSLLIEVANFFLHLSKLA